MFQCHLFKNVIVHICLDYFNVAKCLLLYYNIICTVGE